MINKTYQMLLTLRHARLRAKGSERDVAQTARISRSTLRRIERGDDRSVLSNIGALCEAHGRVLTVMDHPTECDVECATVAIGQRIVADGFESWKAHLMEMVDAFRRTRDPRLLLLPPTSHVPPAIAALMASTVEFLCQEVEILPPAWALKPHRLSDPWFVAGRESLKPSALVESPLPFRRNNIFVHRNFLART